MPEIEGFAERIFLMRNSANKSQEEVALALGLTKSGVSSFERGKSIPSPENLVKLARLFSVSVDYLLTGRDNWSKAENIGDEQVSNRLAVHANQDITALPKSMASTPDDQTSKPIEHVITTEAEEINKIFKHYLKNIKIKEIKFVRNIEPRSDGNQNDIDELSPASIDIPIFDQSQIDKRFLTELDRLLKIKAFSTYTAWAQAVKVQPSYVAAIEKGRYHFNIELLYNTVRHFPDFDFIYVVFGSALSSRPEPNKFPKRERGPRSKIHN